MGRIVTVSDSAGRSVTVSNWGVAQTSRHLRPLLTKVKKSGEKVDIRAHNEGLEAKIEDSKSV